MHLLTNHRRYSSLLQSVTYRYNIYIRYIYPSLLQSVTARLPAFYWHAHSRA